MRGPEGASVQQCTGATRHVPEPLTEGDGKVAGLPHRPFSGGVGGDAAQMHPAGAMFDEHQDVQPLQQHGVHVEEVHSEDPGGLGVQELPPGGTRAARTGSMPAARRISQTVDCATVTPSFITSPWIRRYPHSGFSFASRTTRRAMPGTAGGRPGLAPLARVVLARSQLAMPGQQRRGRHGEDFGPAAAGYEPGQRGEQYPVGRLVAHPPAWRRSTAFSCRSTSSSASFARSVRNTRTARPSIRLTSATFLKGCI